MIGDMTFELVMEIECRGGSSEGKWSPWKWEDASDGDEAPERRDEVMELCLLRGSRTGGGSRAGAIPLRELRFEEERCRRDGVG